MVEPVNKEIMSNSQRYEVILWHRVASSPSDLHQRIIAKAGRQPDEESEMQGFQDVHWNCNSLEDATGLAEAFFEDAISKDLVLLVISSVGGGDFERKVYKDTRKSIKVSS